MALARFTTYVARDRAHPREASRGYGWRLLAANNRDVARSPHLFVDVDECLAAIHALRSVVQDASCVVVRAGRSDWAWLLRHDDRDLAVSSRRYQRRLQCTAACDLFLELADLAVIIEDHADVPLPRAARPSPMNHHGAVQIPDIANG